MNNVTPIRQTAARKAVYIAGPMSGYPGFNFGAFDKAAEFFRGNGWFVYNPAEKSMEDNLDAQAVITGDAVLAIQEGFDFRKAYEWDLLSVLSSDAIFMLKGWEASPGARGEHAVAVAIQKHYPSFEIIYE